MGLLCNPYDERELVAFIEFFTFIMAGDLPTPNTWEVDARHYELIIVCPTPIAFSIALEWWRWLIDSFSSHSQVRPWFLVWVEALSPKG